MTQFVGFVARTWMRNHHDGEDLFNYLDKNYSTIEEKRTFVQVAADQGDNSLYLIPNNQRVFIQQPKSGKGFAFLNNMRDLFPGLGEPTYPFGRPASSIKWDTTNSKALNNELYTKANNNNVGYLERIVAWGKQPNPDLFNQDLASASASSFFARHLPPQSTEDDEFVYSPHGNHSTRPLDDVAEYKQDESSENILVGPTDASVYPNLDDEEQTSSDNENGFQTAAEGGPQSYNPFGTGNELTDADFAQATPSKTERLKKSMSSMKQTIHNFGMRMKSRSKTFVRNVVESKAMDTATRYTASVAPYAFSTAQLAKHAHVSQSLPQIKSALERTDLSNTDAATLRQDIKQIVSDLLVVENPLTQETVDSWNMFIKETRIFSGSTWKSVCMEIIDPIRTQWVAGVRSKLEATQSRLEGIDAYKGFYTDLLAPLLDADDPLCVQTRAVIERLLKGVIASLQPDQMNKYVGRYRGLLSEDQLERIIKQASGKTALIRIRMAMLDS